MNYTHAIMDFVQAHSGWAGPVALIIALAGSCVGLNIFIPAGTILTAFSPLVGLGVVSWTVVLWAAIGAAAGCALSFGLGVLLGPHAARAWPLAGRPELLRRAKEVLARRGTLAIFVGYFLGPLRSTIPVVAGCAGMPHAKFQSANLLSALVWAVAAVAPGAIATAGLEAAHSLPAALFIMMLVAALLVVLRVMLLRNAYQKR